jgi:N-acetylneuraminic acid mutarotase
LLLLAGCGGGGGDDRGAATSDWQFTTPMANRRSYVAAGEIAEKIYVAGGMFGDAGRRLDRVQVFDPRDAVWTTLPTLPVPVRAAAGATRGRDFYVIGGTTPEGGGRQVFVYDTAARRWRSGPPLPRVLYNHSAVTLDDRIYVLGGYDTEGAELRDVYVLENGRWRPSTPLPRPVCTPSARSSSAARSG